MTQARTLYRKIVDAHTVQRIDDRGNLLLYVDRQVLNEYTSPQAFSALREARRRVWRPKNSLAVVDHVNPTAPVRTLAIADSAKAKQVSYLGENCREFGIELFDVLDKRQGIEHVVATEQGFVLPGMVVAAGDSHTITHGGLGALAFGIGTSEIEHLLATQTLQYRLQRSMRITIDGTLGTGVTAKDLVMAVIRDIGADGAAGHVIEYAGGAFRAMSVEGRLTVCNMSVEAAARGALIAPDDKVVDYLRERPRAPRGRMWDEAGERGKTLRSDEDAQFERDIRLEETPTEPMGTWVTSPDQAAAIGGVVPDPAQESDSTRRRDMQRALEYMGLTPGERLDAIRIDRAFIGSCTNGRIEDLRDAARVLRGRRIAQGVRGMVVPGSTAVHDQAEAEGLDRVFLEAGFEWRQSGCSMCVAMNDDHLLPGERCASSTNRNFEGRQGAGGRTHLMSPAMVAAAAIAGRLTDLRPLVSP
ncbi:MAG: 3-isopropylmalate dehydratase large subunit [Casimicrobiaceae bacterium]